MKPPADLGILGGMGPQATHYFTDELLTAIEARHRPRRDQDYPSIFVRYACHIPDRTSALLTDRGPLVRAIAREAEILVELGCPKILMPCITAHALLDSELSGFPFLDIRQVVATHIANSFANATVGILATRGARVSGAVNKLLPATHQAVSLDDREQEQLMNFIYREAKTWGGGKDISPLMRPRQPAPAARRRCDHCRVHRVGDVPGALCYGASGLCLPVANRSAILRGHLVKKVG